MTSIKATLKPMVSAMKPKSGGPIKPKTVESVEKAATFSDEVRVFRRDAAANACGIEIEIPIPISRKPINAIGKLSVMITKSIPANKNADVNCATFTIPNLVIKPSEIKRPKVWVNTIVGNASTAIFSGANNKSRV